MKRSAFVLALLMLAAMPFARAQVAVGDILCEGGQIYTPATYLSSGATAIGVVFYVDGTGQHGWAVALEDAGSYKWGKVYSDTPLANYSSKRTAIYDLDGYLNTQILRQYGSTDYPAYFAVDFNNGWYIPAIGQLNYLFGNLVEVNASLSIIGVAAIPKVPFWSSTEYDNRDAWYIDTNGDLIYRPSNDYNYKSYVRRFRGIINF